MRTKLLMLAAPFLRRWTYGRAPEHMAGGHKYAPPCADVNAPDLYLPLMALWTYAILIGVAVLASGAAFSPEVVYSAVRGGGGVRRGGGGGGGGGGAGSEVWRPRLAAGPSSRVGPLRASGGEPGGRPSTPL